MTRRHSVMITSNTFPPDIGVCVRRAAGLCRHLAGLRWDAKVLAPRAVESAVSDLDVTEGIPATVRVVRARCADLLGTASTAYRRSASFDT